MEEFGYFGIRVVIQSYEHPDGTLYTAYFTLAARQYTTYAHPDKQHAVFMARDLINVYRHGQDHPYSD